jgi:hypothetical protein
MGKTYRKTKKRNPKLFKGKSKQSNKQSNKTAMLNGVGTRKRNCSPIVSNQTVNSDTCYTPDTLIKIKNAYNNYHSKSEYIPWSNPQEIWRTLKKRLVNCKMEDCWLSEIKDKKLSTQLQNVIFAPTHPPEWLKNPNEWLTDLDISRVMKQYESKYKHFKFIGPSPIDFDTKVARGELPWAESGANDDEVCVWEDLCTLSLKELLRKKISQVGMVFNLDRYDEPGSHWVSLYLSLGEPKTTKRRTRHFEDSGHMQNNSHPFIFYFDSTGREAPPEIKTLIDRIQVQARELHPALNVIEYNNNRHDHQKSNTECGMYSLFFLITMLTGKMEDVDAGYLELGFNDKITLFRDAVIPDEYVELYRHKYFNTP